MATYKIEDTTLTNIADAIRTKGGTTATLTPTQMPDAISAIQTGEGGGGSVIPAGIGRSAVPGRGGNAVAAAGAVGAAGGSGAGCKGLQGKESQHKKQTKDLSAFFH